MLWKYEVNRIQTYKDMVDWNLQFSPLKLISVCPPFWILPHAGLCPMNICNAGLFLICYGCRWIDTATVSLHKSAGGPGAVLQPLISNWIYVSYYILFWCKSDVDYLRLSEYGKPAIRGCKQYQIRMEAEMRGGGNSECYSHSFLFPDVHWGVWHNNHEI